MRYPQFEDHDRDDDRQDPVAERLETILTHGAPSAVLTSPNGSAPIRDAVDLDRELTHAVQPVRATPEPSHERVLLMR
jgi:hypothetical protein